MKRTILLIMFAVLSFPSSSNAQSKNMRFDITFPATASNDALDGRLLLLISTNNTEEPRFQISEDLTTQQVFGVDIDGWKAGQIKVVDANAFGYPRRSLTQVPAGEYW